jgi:predicted Zn finger-like uncharacterized protein
VIRAETLAVATACPHCAAPANLSPEALEASGRMMRCARCGTAWLARVTGEDPFGSESGEPRSLPVRQPARPRFERVIEHVGPSFARPQASRAAKTAKPAMSAKPARAAVAANSAWPSRFVMLPTRLLAAWPSVTAVVTLVAIVAVLSLHWSGAMSDDGRSQFAGLEIRLLRGAIEPAREGRALAVEGEISNRSGGELRVPAVRISLRSDGLEVYSWLVEPTTTKLAAGRAVVFRSVLAAPPSGVDEVAFRLAEREDTVIGMK